MESDVSPLDGVSQPAQPPSLPAQPACPASPPSLPSCPACPAAEPRRRSARQGPAQCGLTRAPAAPPLPLPSYSPLQGSWADDFHTFSLEWSADGTMLWKVDDDEDGVRPGHPLLLLLLLPLPLLLRARRAAGLAPARLGCATLDAAPPSALPTRPPAPPPVAACRAASTSLPSRGAAARWAGTPPAPTARCARATRPSTPPSTCCSTWPWVRAGLLRRACFARRPWRACWRAGHRAA